MHLIIIIEILFMKSDQNSRIILFWFYLWTGILFMDKASHIRLYFIMSQKYSCAIRKRKIKLDFQIHI